MLVSEILNIKLKRKNYDAIFNIVGSKIASKISDEEFKYQLYNLNYQTYLNLPKELKENINNYLDKYLKVPQNKKFDELVKSLKDNRIKNIEEFLEYGLELSLLEKEKKEELNTKKENMPKIGDTLKKVGKKINSFNLKKTKLILYKTNVERVYKIIIRTFVSIGLIIVVPYVSMILKGLLNISISGGLINTLVILGSFGLSVNDIRKIRESKEAIELLNKELNNETKEKEEVTKEEKEELEIKKEEVKDVLETSKTNNNLREVHISNLLDGKVEFVLNVKTKTEEYLEQLKNDLEYIRNNNNKSHKELYNEDVLYKEMYKSKSLLNKLYLVANRQLVLYWDIYLNLNSSEEELKNKFETLEINYDDIFKQLEVLKSLGINIFNNDCKVK